MKKNFLHIFITTILPVAMLVSCSFFGTENSEPDAFTTDSQTVKVTGSLNYTGARAASPSMPNTGTETYSVTAVSADGDSVTGSVDNTTTHSYNILLSSQKDWTLKAELKNGSTVLLK